jgi:pyruvate dehydrogenase E1 component
VDASVLLYYKEAVDGQILEEGITEAGSMASCFAAGTAYANYGVPMIPFYTYYSMFGYQRVGDLMWAFADSRGKGFIMGGTAGRSTLLGEGLQHQDGHSPLLMSVIPTCAVYDPAYAFELAVIIQDGIRRMYTEREDRFYYIRVTTRITCSRRCPRARASARVSSRAFTCTARRRTVRQWRSCSGAVRF